MKKWKGFLGAAGGTLSPGGSKARWKRTGRLLSLLLFATLLSIPAWSQRKPADLTDRSIEDLMNIEVTSVSKKEQKLAQTAAAIFVITAEDIRRSGSTNIPDLLRIVPGLDVAQINASSWAISSRGFNEEVSNTLLVLIDGRSVYSLLFSGVFWDVQEVPLEEIERIEIIRGPGAAVWGANAVNGVINIIRKKTSDTQGLLVTGGGGTTEGAFSTVQFGGKFGGDTTYRVDSDSFKRNSLESMDGQNGHDGWNLSRVAFRIDHQPDAKDTLMVQGDGYKGSESEIVSSVTSLALPQPQVMNLRQDIGGWDVLTRWQHTASSTSQTTLQVYFDRTNRSDATYGESRNTFDIDFQHHIASGHRQDFVWGLGVRATSDGIRGSFRVMFNPARETDLLYSSFVQDEIAVIPGRVYVTLDARLEHNRFTGFGFQPGIRITWLANQKTMFWASESRTAEAASRDQDARFNEEVLQGPGGLPILVSDLAVRQRNEDVLSTEAGFRIQLLEGLSLDLAAFYTYNTHIQSTETGTPFVESNPAPVHLVSPFFTANLLHGEGHGAELAVNWKPLPHWTLSPGFSYLQMHFHTAPTSTDTISIDIVEGGTPHEQAQLRSHLELTKHWAWDASAYFVGRLPALQVPAYTRLDAGLTWHPRSGLSISAVGQNLLRDEHLEFNGHSQLVVSSLMKRSVYAKIVWHF